MFGSKAASLISRQVIFSRTSRSLHVENRIKELGLNIPATPEAPKGNYMSYVQSGNMLFLAGHLPKPADGDLICGCVGENMGIEEGKHAAKMASLQMISSMTAALGDLDRVKRIVKINGFVNCTRDFVDQPAVLNGCSDTMVEVFGIEVGRHARSALAANSLPLGVAVEIEAIIEVKD